jgi:hypothetical protein
MPSLRQGRASVRSWFLLAIIAAVTAGLLAGLAYALVATFRGRPGDSPTITPSAARPGAPSKSAAQSAGSERARQDALVAAAMPQLPASAANPQPLATSTPPPAIALPRPTVTTPSPSGFPRTAEGALAQLAAIDASALNGLSPGVAGAVHRSAALPGAVPLDRWTPMVGIRSALRAAGEPDGSQEITSTFTPLAGRIKGTIGDDFVVACVLGEWQVTYQSTTRAGAADCQRMVWSDGRWWIGPGAQPAFPPTAWPGSEDAVRTGWRPLTGWRVSAHA